MPDLFDTPLSRAPNNPPRFDHHRGHIYSVRDALRILGCSRSYLYSSLLDKKLRRRKRGSRVVIFGDDVAEYLESL